MATATNPNSLAMFLAKFRGILQKRRRMILQTTQRAEAELASLRGAERDPEFEEGAQSEHEQYTLSRLGETQRRELMAIDAALERIDSGGYGLCQDCELDIDPKRLEALPYAMLCTECATGRERGTAASVPPPSL